MFLRKWFESRSYTFRVKWVLHTCSLSAFKLPSLTNWIEIHHDYFRSSLPNTLLFQLPIYNTDQNTTTFVWISNRLLAITMTCAQNVETSVLLPTVLSGTPFTRTIKFRLDISFLSSSGNVNLNFHVSKLPHFWTSRTTKLLFLNGKQ